MWAGCPGIREWDVRDAWLRAESQAGRLRRTQRKLQPGPRQEKKKKGLFLKLCSLSDTVAITFIRLLKFKVQHLNTWLFKLNLKKKLKLNSSVALARFQGLRSHMRLVVIVLDGRSRTWSQKVLLESSILEQEAAPWCSPEQLTHVSCLLSSDLLSHPLWLPPFLLFLSSNESVCPLAVFLCLSYFPSNISVTHKQIRFTRLIGIWNKDSKPFLTIYPLWECRQVTIACLSSKLVITGRIIPTGHGRWMSSHVWLPHCRCSVEANVFFLLLDCKLSEACKNLPVYFSICTSGFKSDHIFFSFISGSSPLNSLPKFQTLHALSDLLGLAHAVCLLWFYSQWRVQLRHHHALLVTSLCPLWLLT